MEATGASMSRSDEQSSSREQAFATLAMPAEGSAASYPSRELLPQGRPAYGYQQDADLRSNDSLPSSLDEAQRLYYPLGDRQYSCASLEDDLVDLSSRVQSPGIDEDQ
jgi:hypothetical protein